MARVPCAPDRTRRSTVRPRCTVGRARRRQARRSIGNSNRGAPRPQELCPWHAGCAGVAPGGSSRGRCWLRYLALAADYDGTLATDGRVDQRTVGALERLRSSGRRLVLVTGRELDDLLRVFERIDLCDRVAAENGAVLYDPAARAERPLADPPPERFIARLRERGVAPLAVGRSIVATTEPHEVAVVETIRELGLELHVVFNKGSVMVLPSGVNKATGLAAALAELRLSPHNAVGIGDAENDHAFLAA